MSGVEVEVGGGAEVELDGAGAGVELPVGGGLAAGFDVAGAGAGFEAAGDAAEVDVAGAGLGADVAAAGLLEFDVAGAGAEGRRGPGCRRRGRCRSRIWALRVAPTFWISMSPEPVAGVNAGGAGEGLRRSRWRCCGRDRWSGCSPMVMSLPLWTMGGLLTICWMRLTSLSPLIHELLAWTWPMMWTWLSEPGLRWM